MKSIFIILAAYNVFVLSLYAYDKLRAQFKGQRISEKMIITTAFFFGSLGAIAGMLIFRHKIRKAKFKFLIPLFFILHLLGLFYYFNSHLSFLR